MSAVSIGTRPMTYEDYLAEGETNGRYSIIDGVREYMTAPNWRHQRIIKNILKAFDPFERALGQVIPSPSDVLIRRHPLKVRQPDVLFISHRMLASGGGPPSSGPLMVAPELVVEILSQSDTRAVLQGKLDDYCAIGVEECWVVDADEQTVEVLRLAVSHAQSMAVYGMGEIVASLIFPELTISVDAVFEA